MMALRTFLSTGSAALLLMVACGGDGGGVQAGDGDGDGMGGVSDPSSGGSSSGGSTSNSGGTATADEDNADFTVDVFRFFTSPYVQSVRASSPALDFTPVDCERHETDSCTVAICPITEPSEQQYTYRHAGSVTATFDIEGAPLSGVTVPNQFGYYSQATLQPADLNLGGGETGSITAEGGDVGAFSQDVTFPLLLINTNPVVENADADYLIEAPRSQDLTLTWDRGAPGITYFVQRDGDIEDGTNSYRLTCQFDSALGTATIPADLLSRMPSGSTFFTFTVQNYYQDVGDDRVLVRIVTNTTVPAKDGSVRLRLTD